MHIGGMATFRPGGSLPNSDHPTTGHCVVAEFEHHALASDRLRARLSTVTVPQQGYTANCFFVRLDVTGANATIDVARNR